MGVCPIRVQGQKQPTGNGRELFGELVTLTGYLSLSPPFQTPQIIPASSLKDLNTNYLALAESSQMIPETTSLETG